LALAKKKQFTCAGKNTLDVVFSRISSVVRMHVTDCMNRVDRHVMKGSIMKSIYLQRTSVCLALLGSLLLAACGGGSGSGSPPTPIASISGTAAVGLPLVGSVTVKDAAGRTKSVTLSSNGGYTLDVSGMTAPFVFRAEGTAGGKTYVVHSAATAADVNGNINITPLTDLVVANIAGQVAENYFNSGGFSSLNKSDLDAEVAALKAKLLPVLTAMGVDSSIDLLRTGFTPLSSALDKALDVIRISVDPATNVATITNLVNQQQITDSLAVKAAAESSSPQLSTASMATSTPSDVDGIRQAFTNLSNQFSTGLPAPATIINLLSSTPVSSYTFRHQDTNATDFANGIAQNPFLVGARFTDVTIQRINYTIDSANLSPRAFVSFIIKNAAGIELGRAANFQVVKGADNVWRLRGNGRVLDTEVSVHTTKDAVSGCVQSGLEFTVIDEDTSNSSSANYVVVTGPGLPTSGLEFQRPSLGGRWTLRNAGGQNGGAYYRMTSNCGVNPLSAGYTDSAISAINVNADYVFTAMVSPGVTATFSGFEILYRDRIQARPLTLAEAAAASFPSFTTSVPLANYTGGDISYSMSGLNTGVAAWSIIELFGSLGSNRAEGDVLPTASGTGSITLTAATPSGTITRKSARIYTLDALNRTMMTIREFP
jgi:hypothetical protein